MLPEAPHRRRGASTVLGDMQASFDSLFPALDTQLHAAI